MTETATQPDLENIRSAIGRLAGNDNKYRDPILLEYQREVLEKGNKGVWTQDGSMLKGVKIDNVYGELYVFEGEQVCLRAAGKVYQVQWERLPVIFPHEWKDLPIPDREWFIEGLVPGRQVTILNGDGGVGKSLLALQLAAAACMSVSTLGMDPLAGNAIYVGAEDDWDEFHRRLADIASALDGDMSDLFRMRVVPLADRDALLCTYDKEGKIKPTALWKQIASLVEARGPSVLVLDTAADLFGGDEIKRSQVRQFIAMLRKLAMSAGCAIILLAHPSAAGIQTGSGSSGSTAWNNSVRSRLYMTKGDKDDDPDLRILKTMKANYGKTGDEIKIRWQDGAFVLDDGKPSPASGLINAHHEQTFLRLLSDINRSGQRVSASRSNTYAPTVFAGMEEGTTKKQFEAAMTRLFKSEQIRVVMEGPPSKQRQRLVVIADEIAAKRMQAE